MKNPRKIQSIEFSIGIKAVQGHCGNFHGGSDGKESACNAEDLSSIPWLERSLGEGNGSSFQYSCLEISGTEEPEGLLIVHGVTKSRTRLND